MPGGLSDNDESVDEGGKEETQEEEEGEGEGRRGGGGRRGRGGERRTEGEKGERTRRNVCDEDRYDDRYQREQRGEDDRYEDGKPYHVKDVKRCGDKDGEDVGETREWGGGRNERKGKSLHEKADANGGDGGDCGGVGGGAGGDGKGGSGGGDSSCGGGGGANEKKRGRSVGDVNGKRHASLDVSGFSRPH